MDEQSQPLRRSLTVNVTDITLERIDRHVSRYRPFLRRHAVHRVALDLGLAALESQPELLLQLLDSQEGAAS